MTKFLLTLLFAIALAMPASALDLEAPEPPRSAEDRMPEDPSDFGEGVAYIFRDALRSLRPDLTEAGRNCLSAVAAVMLVSLADAFPERKSRLPDMAGALCVAGMLMKGTGSLVHLATGTINELSEYGKLLLPVMTASLAAQGGASASTALYTGTAAFNALLTSLIAKLLIPLVYIFLGLAAANCAIGEEILKKLRDFVKKTVSQILRIILYVFTGYMAVTGVVSGTTDAAALKATKLTIAGMVPVVGGILSDASEAVLVSAGVVKNTAGIYGILAVLAVCLLPFLRIGVHYLILKVTGAVCGLFGSKGVTDLIGDFSSAMGLLLAMTGSSCLLILISTVCFLREVV